MQDGIFRPSWPQTTPDFDALKKGVLHFFSQRSNDPQQTISTQEV
jgi:hypothetical protein